MTFRRRLIAFILLLVVTPAAAAQLWVTPPRKYLTTNRFRGTVRVYDNLTPIALGAFWPVYGYTFVIGKTCYIQVWGKYYNDRRYRQSLWEHEFSHCGGWPAWHPPY